MYVIISEYNHKIEIIFHYTDYQHNTLKQVNDSLLLAPRCGANRYNLILKSTHGHFVNRKKVCKFVVVTRMADGAVVRLPEP